MRAAVAIDEDRLGAAILQLLHARKGGCLIATIDAPEIEEEK